MMLIVQVATHACRCSQAEAPGQNFTCVMVFIHRRHESNQVHFIGFSLATKRSDFCLLGSKLCRLWMRGRCIDHAAFTRAPGTCRTPLLAQHWLQWLTAAIWDHVSIQAAMNALSQVMHAKFYGSLVRSARSKWRCCSLLHM